MPANSATHKVLATAAAILTMAAGHAQTWDLANNFSTDLNPANDWSYGSTTTLGGFSLYTNSGNVGNWYSSQHGISGFAGWSNPSFAFPLVVKNLTGQTYFQTFAPGDVVAHGYA